MSDQPRARDVLDEVHRRFGRSGLGRIEEAIAGVIRGAPGEGYVPDQRITVMRVPDLAARPFHDPREFPWNAAFEAATDEVLAEFRRVEAARAGFADFEGYGRGWLAWLFHSEGRWFDDTMRLAPKTTELLKSTHHTQGEFLFSELSPGGVIPPHTGGCNAVLSTHLALIVPPGCRIQVGQEVRAWEKGKVIAFDDSFVHGCWNPSTERRICLVWEVWHPGLDELERRAMAFAYQALVNEA